jgi:hypothetical protein
MTDEQQPSTEQPSDIADIGTQLHQIADRLQTLEQTAAYGDELADLGIQLVGLMARLPGLEKGLKQTTTGLAVLTTRLRNQQVATSLQVEALIQSLPELLPEFGAVYAAAYTRLRKEAEAS